MKNSGEDMDKKAFPSDIGAPALYEAFADVSECGIIILGAGGDDAFLDKKAREMLGIADNDRDGYIAIISPLLSELSSGPDFAEKNLTVTAEGAAKTIKARGANIKDDGAFRGSMIALYDITARRETERMQSEFVSRVSHELRTPLTTMKEFAAILLEGLGGEISGKQKKYLKIIHNNISRLNKMVGDLLDISRIEAGKINLDREVAYIDRLINQACFFLEDYVRGKQLKLDPCPAKNLPPVYMDVDRIIQVLTNLIDNAAKHSPCGGIIHGGARLQVGFIRIFVSDSGPGIPQAHHNRLFEKFYQFISSPGPGAGGVGLGLNIAKQIIEMHGGSISVESSPGEGATFSCTLPTVRETADFPSYVERNIELSRAMERKFSLLRINIPDKDACIADELSETLRNELRKATDSNPFRVHDSLFVGLPDTSRRQAAMLAERLKKSFPPGIMNDVKLNMATFSDDGCMAEDLIRKTFPERGRENMAS